MTLAKQVDAAIANVSDAEHPIGKTGGDQGRAHPRSVLALLGIAEDGIIGFPDRVGQQTRSQRGIVEIGVVLNRRLAIAKISEHGFDSDLAGNFARSVPTHPVAHHKNSEPLVVAEMIFI